MNHYFSGERGPERDSFFSSFDQKSPKGIRLNRAKVSNDRDEDIIRIFSRELNRVPWCKDGYYVDDACESVGKDPYYHAGVYYVQEPSAMLPAEILAASPGETVLDLCAAPGGKTTRIGADMRNQGLLVANEISEDRAKALLRNVELFGITNAVITNENPANLANAFPSFFDRILIDAPCSGEGMFRRDKNATRSWETYGPDSCMPVQREILDAAHRMLKPGGHLVYSTCTFHPGENEGMIQTFMERYPEYSVMQHPEISGISPVTDGPVAGAMRIWPHLSNGDGHFCAHLIKSVDASTFSAAERKSRGSKYQTDNVYSVRTAREALREFAGQMFSPSAFEQYSKRISEEFFLHGEKIHLMPVRPELFDRMRVVKMGDFPGEIKILPKGMVFHPSHAFALSLPYSDTKEDRRISFDREDDRLRRYLLGETISLHENEMTLLTDRSYILVAVDQFSLGFAKREGATLKNLYPKAWRLR